MIFSPRPLQHALFALHAIYVVKPAIVMWQYYELHVIESDIFFKMSLIYILDSLSIKK